MRIRSMLLLLGLFVMGVAPIALRSQFTQTIQVPEGRKEVVFWHFWGGNDRAVVADVVRRFNDSQDEYWVREIAMPGNNQQAKLFLSTTGGAPPDLVNQDDPILADWAKRGLIQSMDTIAPQAEVNALKRWMFDSAKRLSVYDDRMFAVCNGLDIRALYYNRTALEQFECEVPATIDELNRVCDAISPDDTGVQPEFYAYLPDSRRLWAWGYVFGGRFYAPETGTVTLDTPEMIAAGQWLQSFSRRYTPENISAFRTGDQSLPGKSFPLLPIDLDSTIGRYVMLMDGQWRTRDLRSFNEKRAAKGLSKINFGVRALPQPAGGRDQAGWVNGNFFVVPRGAPNSRGAWEFIKFWVGFTDAQQAAKTCAQGGWIPVSQAVVQTDDFQSFLSEDPLFAQFVELASSPNQFPVPMIPGAPMFKRTIESAAFQIMSTPNADVKEILRDAEKQIQNHLDAQTK